MSDEAGLLRALNGREDDLARQAYADWLYERGDDAAEFVRLHRVLRLVPPDHPIRPPAEERLSKYRKGREPAWLTTVEPERAHLTGQRQPGRVCCDCFDKTKSRGKWREMTLHVEPQDTECDAWKRLCDVIDECITGSADALEWSATATRVSPEDRQEIVTLPATVGGLVCVKRLVVYGGSFHRMPVESAGMTSLREFVPYTSYRLHWFPYELTRLSACADSTISTRALYGNYKYHPPFPRLVPYPAGTAVGDAIAAVAHLLGVSVPMRPCSVCSTPYADDGRHRVWTTQRVATDDLPLLVNACSRACVDAVPDAPPRYLTRPHRGGKEMQPGAA